MKGVENVVAVDPVEKFAASVLCDIVPASSPYSVGAAPLADAAHVSVNVDPVCV